MNYWSCFSVGTSGSVSTYQDVEGESYNYDGTVPNHLAVKSGDVLIIRDDTALTGFGWVEEVRTSTKIKRMTLCPTCRRSGPNERVSKTPRFRCRNGHEFDQPVFEDRSMTAYEARYAQTWSTFDGLPPRSALDQLYVGADQQNAIRRLDPTAARLFLRSSSSILGFVELVGSTTSVGTSHSDPVAGQVSVVATRRIGQAEFRARLLARYGAVCAVTGPQPREILDAAHLYLFASQVKHSLDGGLLLRSDIHRLFDSFNLAVNPATWTVELSPAAREYEWLKELHGSPLLVHPNARPNAKWLRRHMDFAHDRWQL